MSSAYLTVTSQSIKKYYTYFYSLSRSNNNQIELSNKYAYLLLINMRKCIRGEIYLKNMNMYLKFIFLQFSI